MKVIVDEETEQRLIKQQQAQEMKLAKLKALEGIVVTQHNVEYNGDMTAQSNMGDAGTIANWLFNKSITDTLEQASSAPDATNELKYVAGIFKGVYQAVYVDNKIHWKGADNKIHQVQGESVLEALYKTMKIKSSIIGGTQ